MNIDVMIGDVVELSKEHPCGSRTWEIFRTGMDIGLICQVCDRKIKLQRSIFNKRFKKRINRGNQ